MTGEELFAGIGFIDGEFVEESESAAKTGIRTRRRLAAAACFCIVACGVFFAAGNVDEGAEVPTPGAVESAGLPQTGSEGNRGETPKPDYLAFNNVENMEGTSAEQFFCLTGHQLTEEQLSALAPAEMEDRLEISGWALRYGGRELYAVEMRISGGEGGEINVIVRPDDSMAWSRGCSGTEEAKTGSLDGMNYTAFRFYDGYSCLMWAEFFVGDAFYLVSVSCAPEQEDAAGAELARVVLCYAAEPGSPDLDALFAENAEK